MEHNVLKLGNIAFQFGLQVRFPEKLGISQACRNNLFVTGNNLGTTVLRNNVRSQRKLVGETGSGRITQNEVLLVHLDGELGYFIRQRKEALVVRADENCRPLVKASHFFKKASIFNQFKAKRHRSVLCVGINDVFAAVRIKHNLGSFQFGHVVAQTADLDGLRGHKSVTVSGLPGLDAIHFKRNDFRLFRLRTESANDRVQRTNPA